VHVWPINESNRTTSRLEKHRQESPERAICGNATEDECEALREEGIPVLRLPDIKGEDPN
jgi:hypothetical protein